MGLLDIALPGRGGYSVCRMIKLRPDCGGVQVVMISALAEHAKWETWRKVGADGFITKPFVVEDLVSMIALRLGLMPRNSARLQPTADPDPIRDPTGSNFVPLLCRNGHRRFRPTANPLVTWACYIEIQVQRGTP